MSVRIGIIGAGTQGKSHIDQFMRIKKAEVVSVYDADRTKAEQAAREIRLALSWHLFGI